MNASHTIVLGEDEMRDGTATVKKMESGDQRTVSLDALTALIKG
jgi:histidyl-tRNA synthetase